MSRIKRGLNYKVCPMCLTGKVKKVGENQYYCESCKSTWTFNADNVCKK